MSWPITLTDPMPKIKCLQCGKEYEYDPVMGYGCLTLRDETSIPTVIRGAWCNQECFDHWLDSPQSQYLFDE